MNSKSLLAAAVFAAMLAGCATTGPYGDPYAQPRVYDDPYTPQDESQPDPNRTRQGDNITLDMPSAITFAFDSSSLNPAFHGTLDRLANTMNEYGQTIIEIAGHTDSVGTDSYNQTLSVQRAQAVANYLIARGVNRERIIVTGAGESRPVASNDTEAGRAENRRVEITLVPLRE